MKLQKAGKQYSVTEITCKIDHDTKTVIFETKFNEVFHVHITSTQVTEHVFNNKQQMLDIIKMGIEDNFQKF